MKSLPFLLCCLFGTLLSVSCQRKKASVSPEASRFTVVCTTGMIADVTRQVAGPEVEVVTLIGEGIDPHLYQPSMRDTKALLAADLIFYNGFHLEGKMGHVFQKVKAAQSRVYAVAEAVASLETEGLSSQDPHLWMDVRQWEKVTVEIARLLSRFDPPREASYQQRLQDYRMELTALHQYAQEVLGSIPSEQRLLVTAHDAFGYMESAYGVEVRAIQGLSTESEAGLKDLEDLVAFLVKKKVPAVFVESSVSEKNVRALVEGARAKGHATTIGGTLYSDAMGPAGTYEGTYLGMIDHNVTTIARALGGSAPATGRRGQLTPDKAKNR